MSAKKKVIKKVASIALILLLLVLIGGVLFAYSVLRASLPKSEGVVEVEGLNSNVKIYRDELGRPHIYASTIEDLFFGQGFVHAQDRLWQMELHRRAGQGRISEIIGRSELETDILLRTVGLPRVAQILKKNSTAQTTMILSSYSEGINAYLNTMKKVPPEFLLLGFEPEPWTVDHVFGVAALMAFDSANNYQNELFRLTLQQELPAELFNEMLPPIYPDNDVPAAWADKASNPGFSTNNLCELSDRIELVNSSYCPSLSLGSNGWCLSPDKTASGLALYAFDSHDSLSMPSLYYENRLVIEGELDLYGWSAPGMAAMIDGFNEFIAWGLTNIGDTQDLFLEKRNPDNPYQFLYDDQWYDADVITEFINVKGEDEPVKLEIIITRNGSLISVDPAISLGWTALHSDEGFDALLEINFAQNWSEFREAANKFTMPSTNFTYADVEGNVAFRTVGLLPIRQQGFGTLPSPGWDPEYGWDGFIPMDELPELFNPPKGFVAAANAVVARDDYPYIISVDNAPGYRIRRIVEVLEASNNHDLETMKALQTDWYNAHAAMRLPDIIEVLNNNSNSLSGLELAGLELLTDWQNNPVNAMEETGPAIFETFYIKMIERVFLEKMGEELFNNYLRRNYMVYENLERFWDQGNSAWFGDAALDEIILDSYKMTIADLAEALGTDASEWRWDKRQTISYKHDVGNELGPLSGIYNRGPYPFGGGHMTVGRAGHRLNDPFKVTQVATIRVVAEMGSHIKAYGVIPIGQSGHPLSRHYDDQIDPWLSGEYFNLYHKEVPPGTNILELIPK
ncbi:MAG: penicillin acylase family protein [Bacillota bacterium]